MVGKQKNVESNLGYHLAGKGGLAENLVEECIGWVVKNFRKCKGGLQYLPVGVKLHVLEALVRDRLLSDSHLEYVLDPSFTKLSFDHTHVGDAGLAAVSERCPRLVSLSVRDCPGVTDAGIARIFAGCPLLRDLIVANNEARLLRKHSLRVMRSNCRALRRLCLDHCTMKERDFLELLDAEGGFIRELSLRGCLVSDRWLSAVALKCTMLESLHVAGAKGLTVSGVVEVVRQCDHLGALDLSSLPLTSRDLRMIVFASYNLRILNLSFVRSLCDTVITQIANSCPNLERLIVTGVHGWKGLTLHELLYNCRSLRELILDNCKDIEDEAYTLMRRLHPGTSLETFLEAAAWHDRVQQSSQLGADGGVLVANDGIRFCPRYPREVTYRCALEVLSICGQSKVRDSGLAGLAPMCSELQHVNISGLHRISNRGVKDLVTYAPRLSEIDTSLCLQLDSAACDAIGSALGGSLRKFRAYGNVNFQDLGSLGTTTTNLRVLSLYGCRRLSEQTIRKILHNNPGLEVVDLSLTNTSNECLAALAGARNLRTIRLNSCPGISTAGVVILSHLPVLQTLSLNNVDIDDDLLEVLARRTPSLQILSLASDTSISDRGFILVCRGLPKLQRITVSCSSNISGNAIGLVHRDRPGLKIRFV